MYKLFKLFTQHELTDAGSRGEAEKYEREFETVTFAGALFALLAMLFWSLSTKAWFQKYHSYYFVRSVLVLLFLVTLNIILLPFSKCW